jgi:hypothetical protein
MNMALSVKHTVMLDTIDHYVLANLDAKRNALEQVFSRYLREWPPGEDESIARGADLRLRRPSRTALLGLADLAVFLALAAFFFWVAPFFEEAFFGRAVRGFAETVAGCSVIRR